jgi:hypothetical protein
VPPEDDQLEIDFPDYEPDEDDLRAIEDDYDDYYETGAFEEFLNDWGGTGEIE